MHNFGLKIWVANTKMGKINKNKEKIVIRLWNYMGVFFRLPIASPRHRLMETHYVH